MQIDLELYRREVRVSIQPEVFLSVIDIAPDLAERPMVFIHGFGGKALQWAYQLDTFSETNRAIAVDLRGHGYSSKSPHGYNMQEILSDLRTVMDTLGLTDNIVLVGHSFGGAIACEYAVANPQRIGRLVLIATTGEFRLNPIYRLLLRLPSKSLQAFSHPTRNWLGAPPHILKAMYQQSLSKWQGWELFHQLQLPTLVIHGHLDTVFARPMFERVAKAIPASEEVDVGASGHMVMLERQAAVNRAITRFLESDQRSWSQRGISASSPHSDLLKERPWLSQYEPGVPYTIAIPRIPVQKLLESAVRRFPNRTALIYEGKRISYRQLDREVNRFANFLITKGIQPGERVMLFLPNLPQTVIAFFGCLKAGAVVVFSWPSTNPAELIRQIRDSRSSVLVTLTEYDDLIHEINERLKPDPANPLKAIIFTHISDYLRRRNRLQIQASPKKRKQHLLDIPLDENMYVYLRVMHEMPYIAPHIERSPAEIAVIQYTGGTTDQPHGVMLSHLNLVANALQVRHWMPEAQETGERFICALPFSHSYGLMTTLLVPVTLGATMILKTVFDVKDILHTIKEYQPTFFPGVPSMFRAIKDFPGVRKYGLESLRACISGSDPLPVEVQESFEKLTRGRLIEGYGLTEASPVTHINPLSDKRKVGSIGFPLPSTEARLIDLRKGTQDVPIGDIGELVIRGPQVMLGYWNAPQATSQVLMHNGWLRTGDIAQIDQQGYFRIIARKADMWYPSHSKRPVFPRDIEEVIYEIPQVKDVAVAIVAGQPIAFVIGGEQKPTADAILAYCKRRLPPELTPRLVIFVDEFPRSFIGKVLRRELTRRYQENQTPKRHS